MQPVATLISLLSAANSPGAWRAPADGVAEFLLRPLREAAWGDWRGFWLGEVFDDRFVVVWFLPLAPVLLLARGERLRPAIVGTGLAWLAYVYGVFYAVFWLGLCVGLHRLAERYAEELRRPVRPRVSPQAAAWWLLGCGYLAFFAVKHVRLPTGVNEWLHAWLPLLYPLGARGLAWEPSWGEGASGGVAPQLFRAVFANPHNIGIAYLAVRMLHYFSEAGRGGIPAASRGRLNFLAWTCYAPALMQGPLERYGRFQEELDGCDGRRGWGGAAWGAGRIVMGVLKSVTATLYFRPAVEGALGRGGAYYENPAAIGSYALLYFGVYVQIFWLYLEFSGYCDVSAGVARLLGYRQVENFRMPWLATSLRDFWRRWHISLSQTLRDYVYIPLGGSRRRHVGNLCLTFGLCGLWHAPLPRVAMWGVVMGLMVAAHHAWHKWMERLDARPGGVLAGLRRGWLRLGPLPRVCAWALTIHCFVMSLLIFFGGSGGFRVAGELLRRPLTWIAGGR